MMTIEEILEQPIEQCIALLRDKAIILRPWLGVKGLREEYEPDLHPVMDKAKYPDVTNDDGSMDYVTRVPLNFQKLAVKRMTELCCGIPVKRIYTPENDRQAEVAKFMENIYKRTRIDSVNNERLRMLFASCEVMTLWFAVQQRNNLYGFESNLKLRCRNFSPMLGDELYPLFDETGDLIALSVQYRRKVGKNEVSYFDVYVKNRHILYSTETTGNWSVVADEKIELGKIPAIYMFRPEPIWEDTSTLVYEMEWSLSRNGNYLRKNSKPVFVVSADEAINYGNEENEKKEYRAIVQLPTGASANYVTWQQATESLKFQVENLRSLFFTQLQMPDWSYEKMSQQALSGESRKQMFIDAQLKVKDESGRLVEFLDREVNVLRTFLSSMNPSYAKDIEALQVENEVIPFTITDEADTINNLMTATGGKAIISQKEAIQTLGWSADPDATLEQISKESNSDVFGGGFV